MQEKEAIVLLMVFGKTDKLIVCLPNNNRQIGKRQTDKSSCVIQKFFIVISCNIRRGRDKEIDYSGH